MSRLKQKLFHELIAPSLGRLFRTAYRLTGNVPDAEDLVQDACVAAGERLDALETMEHSERWLLRVLHNRFIDGMRRKARAPVVNLQGAELPGTATADPLQTGLDESTDGERAFLDACMLLSDSHRALLALRAEGYALPEIAEITGIDIAVLRGRLHRARESLARHLSGQTTTDVLEVRLGSKR